MSIGGKCFIQELHWWGGSIQHYCYGGFKLQTSKFIHRKTLNLGISYAGNTVYIKINHHH
jgi:hypothetical protein